MIISRDAEKISDKILHALIIQKQKPNSRDTYSFCHEIQRELKGTLLSPFQQKRDRLTSNPRFFGTCQRPEIRGQLNGPKAKVEWCLQGAKRCQPERLQTDATRHCGERLGQNRWQTGKGLHADGQTTVTLLGSAQCRGWTYLLRKALSSHKRELNKFLKRPVVCKPGAREQQECKGTGGPFQIFPFYFHQDPSFTLLEEGHQLPDDTGDDSAARGRE